MGDKDKKERIEEYEKELLKRKIADSTVSIYLREANRIETFIGTGSADYRKVDEYVHSLKVRYKIGTVNLYIIALNVYLKYIGKEYLTVKSEHITHRRNLENVINMEEYHRILEYTKVGRYRKYYMIIRTLASTGIRVSELGDITVERLQTGYINVYNKGRARELYLPDFLVTELLAYCQEEEIVAGNVFRGNRGDPISHVAVWQMLQKLAEELGIPREKMHPHSFRHLFAKRYMDKYRNLFELADILGHSSIETTRIYTISTVEEKRSKMEEMGM